MVYKDSFIVAVKHKGKVLREFENNVVRLPFGSDYTLLLKNKDVYRKALVSVKIDGRDVLDGNSLIISPDSFTELKGIMKGSKVRNKFRFIERTSEISNYRGNHLEDGLIEIDFVYEELAQPTISTGVWYQNTTYYNIDNVRTYSSAANIKCSANTTGITVPGQVTDQDFVTGSIGKLDNCKKRIIIQLLGKETYKKSDKVRRPVTVKKRIRCSTCGRRWKSSMLYCGNCSTYLH